MRKLLLLIVVAIMSFGHIAAKNTARFNINAERQVFVTRSTTPGKKMLKVIASGSNADKAINQALCDVVAAITFFGAQADGEMEAVPAILKNGIAQYNANKKAFDKFFKKGQYLNFVVRANSTYPSGQNNIKTSNGRKVQIIVIVDYAELASYYQSQGYETITSSLQISKYQRYETHNTISHLHYAF